MKTIRLAIRSILHFRMYSGVNLLGMALSLACVIIIFRYVYGEFTVDRFNKNLDRIYVTTNERSVKSGEVMFSAVLNLNRETTFVDLTKHPGVENYSHFFILNNNEIDLDDKKYKATVLVADSNFLKITDYPVISGLDKLNEPKSALITQRFAQKLLGNQNPVGRTFQSSNGEILTITGVIGQISTKTMLSFDVIIPYYVPSMVTSPMQTIVLLYPNVDYQAVNKQYEAFFDMPRWGYQIRHQLFPLSKMYFDKSISNYVYSQGNINYVRVLIVVGVLILFVGIVSYINIHTVVVLRRGRELGLKKIFGAEGYNIFIQLTVENLLMTGIALIVAFIIVQTANPFIINVIQLDQVSSIRFDVFLSFTLLLCIPLIATLYPFFRYHYSTVVNSLRNFDKAGSSGGLRKVFLLFQYVITIVMIVVSLFFVKQLQFMLNTEPGYRTGNIIKAHFIKYRDRRGLSREEWDMERNREEHIAGEIVQKMNACPLFTHWTYGESPNEFKGNETAFKLPDGEYKDVNIKDVDERWLKLFEIQLKEGRLWDDETDSFYGYSLIVTESVLKQYGITDFNSALLQPESRLWWSFGREEEMKTNPPYRIVGVVKDFNYLHLSQKSDPIAFYYSGGSEYRPLIASIVPGRTQEAIVFLRNLHDETVGGEFSYSFVEDEIREMYKEDKKIATIYSIFTFIAIFISVLGLLSMSLFDIQQRRKEIAIRKVNGATATDIIRLLLKKYFWSLVISFFIASPVAILAINRYLEDFAHKAPVSWWLFAVAIVITAGISLLTLIYQTQKAANRNPAEVVKTE